MKYLILDNGSASTKVGYSTMDNPLIVQNSIVKSKIIRNRLFIGDEVKNIPNPTSLYFMTPFVKGFVTNWETQKQIWDYIFDKPELKVDFGDTSILVTEPYFNFVHCQDSMSELLFEQYGFSAILKTNAACMSSHYYSNENTGNPHVLLVVDSGYSFTHVVPFIDLRQYKEATLRIDVGGKILTNYLKEVISYRQLMVMGETVLMNECKEDCCYVSLDFEGDMQITNQGMGTNSIVRDYVLPDYTERYRGQASVPTKNLSELRYSDKQVIRMNNERFFIPEILFHPSIAGINQIGVAEAIFESINRCPPEFHEELYRNVVLTGGCAKFPNFAERVFKDLRSMVSMDYDLIVTLATTDPISYAWHGGTVISEDPDISEISVSKCQYEEFGPQLCHDYFSV